MKYINTVTGAIIDSPCIISGGDWIEMIAINDDVEDNEKDKEVTSEGEESEKEVTSEGEVTPDEGAEEIFNGITIREIKQELDAFGIKYNPKANKQELYDLMMQGR